jgi:dCTP deaminase
MILSGSELARAVGRDAITIAPFREKRLNPNSYDISIGRTVCTYEDGTVLDGCTCPAYRKCRIPREGLLLAGNKFHFAYSRERLVSDIYVPMLHNRSGVARKGFFTHITADLLQLHHDGRILLQLLPHEDVVIYPGQPIAQISFWKTFDGEIKECHSRKKR